MPHEVEIEDYGTVYVTEKSGRLDDEHIILESLGEANRSGANFPDGTELNINLKRENGTVTHWLVDCRMAFQIYQRQRKEG